MLPGVEECTRMVSWLFLAVSVFGALWTVVSLRPPHRPAPLMAVGFFAAWTTTEMAPLHIAWQAVAVVVFARFGAFDAWPGWLGLAVTLLSWAGLVRNLRRSVHTNRVFAEAMTDTAPEPGPVPAPGTRWSRAFVPFWFARRGVERVRNLDYAGDGSKRHRLDVYRRADAGPGAPVLLQIHGGGWMISNKDQQGRPLMYHLADHGWVCVAINYALSPKGTWPDHLVDCKRALAWVRAHIAEYGGDPDYVVVTGGSAGGHLTAMMGLTANDPGFQPGFEDADTTVRAMIPFYGVYDWAADDGRNNDGLRALLERYVVKEPFAGSEDLYRSASPLHRVHPGAPPALIVHGDLDTLAPVEEARRFVARLREEGGSPVVYVELHGAHHAFEVYNSIRTIRAIDGVEAFLAWLLRTDPPRRDRSAIADGNRDHA